jgi:branched-chain amino acid transport system permease protein
MTWVHTIVQGILLGGYFALFATGLSLMFGVMRLVNLAHGSLALVAAFCAVALVNATGMSAWLTLVIVVPAAAVVGYALQRWLLNATVGGAEVTSVLVTFGLAVIISNVLLQIFSANSQGLQAGSIGTASVHLFSSLYVGWFDVVTFLVAVAVLSGLQFVTSRTTTGRLMRASSDDPRTALLMGVNTKRVYATATAIAVATVALAGIFFGMHTQFSPTSGNDYLLFGFETVVIGGLGSIWGTLVGGIVLGLAQTIGAQINPADGVLAGHLVFLVVLVLRPEGLFSGGGAVTAAGVLRAVRGIPRALGGVSRALSPGKTGAPDRGVRGVEPGRAPDTMAEPSGAHRGVRGVVPPGENCAVLLLGRVDGRAVRPRVVRHLRGDRGDGRLEGRDLARADRGDERGADRRRVDDERDQLAVGLLLRAAPGDRLGRPGGRLGHVRGEQLVLRQRHQRLRLNPVVVDELVADLVADAHPVGPRPGGRRGVAGLLGRRPGLSGGVALVARAEPGPGLHDVDRGLAALAADLNARYALAATATATAAVPAASAAAAVAAAPPAAAVPGRGALARPAFAFLAGGRLAPAAGRPVRSAAVVVAATARPRPRVVVLDAHVDLRLVPGHLRLGVRLAGGGADGVGGGTALSTPRGAGDRVAGGAGPEAAHAVPVGEPPGDETPLQAEVLGRADRLRPRRQPHERGVARVQVPGRLLGQP